MNTTMGVRLSKEYGVNPSVTCCEICGKEIGIALFGTGYKDPKTGKTTQAPPKVAMGLCDDCKKVLDAKGLIIIKVRDGESGNNPYRTGRLTGITKEAKERMFKDINSSVAYMEHTMFEQIFGEMLQNQD